MLLKGGEPTEGTQRKKKRESLLGEKNRKKEALL